MNKKLIVANWKMNLAMHESSLYLHKLAKAVPVKRNVEVVLAPSTFTLQSLSLQINRRQFKLAAQNFYWRDSGAFTGEVSIAQLRGIVNYGLVGHSERRHIFNETDKDIRAKVQAAVRSKIDPILCVGETLFDRAEGETRDVLVDQLVGGLANITAEEAKNCVIAYEPVWAIGSGETASPSDVESAVKIIRQQLRELFNAKIAKEVRVIYGGSVDAESAGAFLDTPGVDGLIIGGASLKLDQFVAIVGRAANTK